MITYEYKVLKVKVKKNVFSSKYYEEDHFEEILNKMGRSGWNLISSLPLTSNGTLLEVAYHFSRPSKNVSELV